MEWWWNTTREPLNNRKICIVNGRSKITKHFNKNQSINFRGFFPPFCRWISFYLRLFDSVISPRKSSLSISRSQSPSTMSPFCLMVLFMFVPLKYVEQNIYFVLIETNAIFRMTLSPKLMICFFFYFCQFLVFAVLVFVLENFCHWNSIEHVD